jgi:carbon starvation protein
VTLTASYQKVFSDNPKLGFFAQRDTYKDALDAGKVLPPAKDADQMQAVVTNSTVDGVLAALFAALIIVVILDAARVWVKAIRARAPLPSTEAEAVPSRIVAPAGLFWTDEDRALLAEAGGAGGDGSGRNGRFARDREKAGTRAP